MTTKQVLTAVGCAMGCALTASAQNSDFAPLPVGRMPSIQPSGGGVSDALGTVVAGPFDIQNPVVAPADNGCLGVAAAFGHFWVAGRGSTGAIASHRIHKFSMAGAYLESYQQNSASVAWGGRDGAANEAANLLYFGEETGRLTEYKYDPLTQDITFNRAISLAGVSADIIRALAFNPTNGHFYTANFGSAITEFTIDPPTLVAVHANPGALAIYGLAYAEATNTIWAFSQNATAATAAAPNFHLVKATELAAANMALTGRSFDGAVVPVGAVAPDNIAGGAEMICDHPGNPGKLSMVAVHQATPDVMVVYDVEDACGDDCYPDCNGDGALTVADFGCFQTAFVSGNMYADCNGDGQLTVPDFGCFQTQFVAGCP